MKKVSLWALIKETLSCWVDDDASTYAASLAYYTVFSLSPTLLIAVALGSLFFGRDAARGRLRDQLGGLVGDSGAAVIEDMMVSASHLGAGVVASVLGGLVLLLGATGVFAALQTALNRIWRAPPSKRHAVVSFLRTRFLSLAMILGVGFLLLVSLVISAAIAAFGDWFGGLSGLGWQVANFLVSFVFVTALFSMIYKTLPDVPVAWGDVWLGAAVTAGLFNLGKIGIGLYLGRSAVASSYGATGALAVLLIWIYYSSMILFLGAEFTSVYARRRGSRREDRGQPP
jgi:membrane protein